MNIVILENVLNVLPPKDLEPKRKIKIEILLLSMKEENAKMHKT